MMIRYILGRTGTGKTEFISRDIKKKLEEGQEKLILIVPEQYTLEAEKDIINRLGVDGIMELQVLSFNRLCHMVVEIMGGFRAVEINDIGKAMILRGVFEKHMDEFAVYQTASRKQGFISEFISQVKEFKKSGIGVEALDTVAEEIEDYPFLRNKLKDITLGMTYFEKYLGDDFFDEEDKYNYLIDNIHKVEFLKGATLWIDGFNSFSAQEFGVLEELMKVSDEMSVALTIDINLEARDLEVFHHSSGTLTRLRKIAGELSIAEKKKDLNAREVSSDAPKALQWCKDEFFAYPFNKYQGSHEGIDIFRAENYYKEVEAVAKKIQEFTVTENYKYRDFSILTGALSTYGPIIKRVFKDYDIPWFVDEKIGIMNNPIVVYLLSALKVVEKGFRQEDVFRFMKTGLSDVDSEQSEALENYALANGIKGNRWLEPFTWGEEDQLVVINETRETIVKPLKGLNASIKGKKNVKERVIAFYKFMESESLNEKINEFIEKFKDLELFEYANLYAQIWNSIMDILDQLVELEGNESINISDFYKEIEAGFNEIKLSIIPPTMDQVFVGDFHRSKSSTVKASFIVGMNDGVIPSAGENGSLLVEEEKMVMKEKGLEIKSDNLTISRDEDFKLYLSLSKPTEYLWLSYSMADIEGKALRSSIYLEKIKNVFEDMEEQTEIDFIGKPLPVMMALVSEIRNYLDGIKVDEKWWEIAGWFTASETWKGRFTNILGGLFHENQLAQINREKALSLYQTPLKTNVSRLENYASCPFSHFIKYGLKPSERKEYEVTMPDVGNLFHTAVDTYSMEITKLNKDWQSVSREEMEGIIDSIVDRSVENYGNQVFSSTFRYKYLVNKIKRIGKRAVHTLTEQLKFGGFEPSAYELEFSFSGSPYAIPPIVMELDNGERVYIEGRIDRVDLLDVDGEKFVKIIDYKSGSKKLSLSDIYYGFQMQLMVYLNAIIENSGYFRENELYPGGVFYFKIDDPLINGDSVTPEQIEQEIFKKLKMDGLVVEDIKVASGIDNKIETDNKSDIISYELKKDGELSSRSQAVPMEDFKSLLEHVNGNIKRLAMEILEGQTEIKPIKEKNHTACDYCDYKAICQFDLKFKDNSFKNIRSMEKEDVLEKVRRQLEDK